MKSINIDSWNQKLRSKSPYEIVDWALQLSNKRIVTTSFGKYSAVLLHTFSKMDPGMDIVWCDTGFNGQETYHHARHLYRRFELNLHTYVPLQTRAHIEATLGIPAYASPEHADFTEIVKLEPFRRALAIHDPDIWFTNIRERQTELRDSKDILSLSKDGILKVSPYYYCSDDDLDAYLERFDLPKNVHYFDPIKALASRECGIHFQ